MAKAVILRTFGGVYLMGNFQCSNGAWFDAEGCFKYCNLEKSEFLKEHQAGKLISNATFLGPRPRTGDDWYKHRENFIDVEIPYDDVEQEYFLAKK